MGGWTRIWVVLTVAAGALAGWVYVDNVRYAEQRANTDYENALNLYDNCRRESVAPKAAPADSSPFDEYLAQQPAGANQVDPFAGLCAGTDGPREQFAQKQAQQRADAVATAKRAAFGASVSIVGWVSGTVGALFLAVGWVRRGFRNKKQG
ncbi:hypothetical protein [Burkholderia sp. USMB20]|uniref:hypothetical protein n=1 Tax=Burkholderia sp. USMB20 TaxID=1571773 RepID=UPI0005CEF208|nr:hypothetical protein [Burkholderia sp. USMB20]TGN95592.1 hypothetical protein PL79_021010 [Burkholderia sp. USMB20]